MLVHERLLEPSRCVSVPPCHKPTEPVRLDSRPDWPRTGGQRGGYLSRLCCIKQVHMKHGVFVHPPVWRGSPPCGCRQTGSAMGRRRAPGGGGGSSVRHRGGVSNLHGMLTGDMQRLIVPVAGASSSTSGSTLLCLFLSYWPSRDVHGPQPCMCTASWPCIAGMGDMPHATHAHKVSLIKECTRQALLLMMLGTQVPLCSCCDDCAPSQHSMKEPTSKSSEPHTPAPPPLLRLLPPPPPRPPALPPAGIQTVSPPLQAPPQLPPARCHPTHHWEETCRQGGGAAIGQTG